jgi:hypothetical protein
MNADGTGSTNLTRTGDVDELYPKASPDGSRIAFVADEGQGEARVRNLYWMRRDGSGRTLVEKNAREPCWSADGSARGLPEGRAAGLHLHRLRDEGQSPSMTSRPERPGSTPRLDPPSLHPQLVAGGKWFVAPVHGGMGFSHAILALEAEGKGVYDLQLKGLPPGPDRGWEEDRLGHGDFAIGVADLDLTAGSPKALNQRDAVHSADPLETYHYRLVPRREVYLLHLRPQEDQEGLKGLIPELPGSTAPG